MDDMGRYKFNGKPIYDIEGNLINAPKRWERMVEVLVGTGGQDELSCAAASSLGIPLFTTGANRNAEKFYHTEFGQRVHLNAVPPRLLHVLYNTTPANELHIIFSVLKDKGIVLSDEKFPKLERYMRSALCAFDSSRNLLEMPENLEKFVLSFDSNTYHGGGMFQKYLAAFYAPVRVRTILYYTSPPAERTEFLLNEEEHAAAKQYHFQPTDNMFRFRLMQRFSAYPEVKEVDQQLFDAILVGEIVDEESLLAYDKIVDGED